MACAIIKAHGGKALARGLNAERHGGNLKGFVMIIEFDAWPRQKHFT